MGILNTVPSDTLYQSDHYALKKLFVWEALKYNQKTEYWRELYISTLKDYMLKKKFYYQIRVLSMDGKEKISVKYDAVKDRVIEEIADNLQDKSNKAYFKNTINLKKGEFYISEINLNMEHGVVEKPIVPVVRYSTPIVDDNGQTRGIVVLNLYVENIFKVIQKQNEDTDKRQVFLINQDGEYLYNADEKKRWASELGSEFNFKNDFKDVFPIFKERNDLIFVQNDKIFSVDRIYPNDLGNRDRYWYFVSALDADVAFSSLDDFVQTFFAILIAVLGLGLYLSNAYVSKLMNPLTKVTAQLKALSFGEIKKKASNTKRMMKLAR